MFCLVKCGPPTVFFCHIIYFNFNAFLKAVASQYNAIVRLVHMYTVRVRLCVIKVENTSCFLCLVFLGEKILPSIILILLVATFFRCALILYAKCRTTIELSPYLKLSISVSLPLSMSFYLYGQSKEHYNENSIYVFIFWELRGLSPNFHIHVAVSDLYCISPLSVHIFGCSKIGRSILIYKYLTDIWM